MQQFLTILAFYRPFAMWSFVINIAIAVVNPFIIPAIITKTFLTVFVWFRVSETHAKRKLSFYRKLGIGPIRLFGILFLVDVSLTLAFLQLVRAYI